jgi:hypothetical protein
LPNNSNLHDSKHMVLFITSRSLLLSVCIKLYNQAKSFVRIGPCSQWSVEKCAKEIFRIIIIMASKREQLVVSCTDHNPPKQELTSCITQSDAKKKRSELQEGNENDRVGKGMYNLKGSNCWRHCAHKKAHSLTPYCTKKCFTTSNSLYTL